MVHLYIYFFQLVNQKRIKDGFFYFLAKRYSSSIYGPFNLITKSLLEIVTFLGTKKNNVFSL